MKTEHNLTSESTEGKKSRAVTATIVDKKAEIKRQPAKRITDEEIYEILGLMKQGYSERAACKEVGVLSPTFRQAVARQAVQSQYAEALAVQATAQVIEVEKTLQELRDGEIDAATARVIIDTRKWFASKLLPRTYGDKLDVTSGGEKLPTPLLGSITTEGQA